jgi:hypothetical protein
MTRALHRAAVLVVFAIVAAACGGGDNSTADSTTVMPTANTAMPVAEGGTSATETTAPATSGVTTEQPSDESPEDWAGFEPAFMSGCSAEMGEEQCACMFDEFQNRYELDDFFSWAYQSQDDPRIVEVAELCSR